MVTDNRGSKIATFRRGNFGKCQKQSKFDMFDFYVILVTFTVTFTTTSDFPVIFTSDLIFFAPRILNARESGCAKNELNPSDKTGRLCDFQQSLQYA